MRASHTKRVIAFAGGYRPLSHIYSWSVRHFKSFRSSFITKGHPVNKHRCPFMNRRLCWGPMRRADWMDRILIDTFGSSSPAAVIQGGLCRSQRGGSRRRKEQKRWVRIVKKTHKGTHTRMQGMHWSKRDRGWHNDFLSALSHTVSNNQSSVSEPSNSVHYL